MFRFVNLVFFRIYVYKSECDGEDEDEEALNLWVGQLKFGFNHCTRSRLNSHKCQIEVWLNVNLNVKSVTL